MELEPFFDSFADLAPTLQHDFVLQQLLVPLARAAFDQKDSFLGGLDGAGAAVAALRQATAVTPPLAEALLKVLQQLDEKMRHTPPFPTTSDHWALGVLRLCAGNPSGALMAFSNAGKLAARGPGLCGRVEALFALRRFDDVVACVIAAETSDGVLGAPVEEEKKRMGGFAAKALQSVVGRRGSSGNVGGGGSSALGGSGGASGGGASGEGGGLLTDDPAWQALLEEDNKVLLDMSMLRRALSYHELHKSSGNDVYQFKCSQDFAVMFQASQRPDSVTALLKASKAHISENPETSCALFHQAASCNPRMWEFPYLSSVSRNRSDARAMIDIEAALRLDPDNRLMRMRKILLMLEQRRAAEASKELHSLVLADPGNAWLGLLRGRARMLTEDGEGAEADFRRLVATWEKQTPVNAAEEAKLNRAKGRLYCELAGLVTALARDPEKERLGLKTELLHKADLLLGSCIDCDASKRHHSFAFKLRSELRGAAERPQESAADYCEFVRCLAQRKPPLEKAALHKEFEASCKMFRKLKDAKETARVATMALAALGDDSELRAHWKYHLASANMQLRDAEIALLLAREGLASAPNERDKTRLLALVLKCGGSVEEAAAAAAAAAQAAEPKPVSQARPLAVPSLQLSSLKGGTKNRRKTTTEAPPALAALVASGGASGSPSRARKAKSGRSTSAVSKSISDVGVVFPSPNSEHPPTPPPVPPPYDGELPSPPQLVHKSKSDAEPSAREAELLAEVARLTAELAEARAVIESLKGGMLF